MGLFSTTSTVYVSSVAYNLGGPIEDRPDFLKTVVFESAITNSDSIVDDVNQGLLRGPGIEQRSFYRWSKNHYPEGTCEGEVNQGMVVDLLILATEIVIPAGSTMFMNTGFLDIGEIVYWGARWILENNPSVYYNPWIAEYDAATQEMVLTFDANPPTRVSYPEFSTTEKFIYGFYTLRDSGGVSTNHIFIYKMNTGNVNLDALGTTAISRSRVFPVIPLRLDNKPISHVDFEVDYPQYAKAYKKMTGEDITDILASIEENPSVGDIDYAFVVHGVELNTKAQEGLRYIYEFFKDLVPLQARNAWIAAQNNPFDPLYGTPEPDPAVRDGLAVTRFEYKTTSALNYESHTNWVTIDEEEGVGLGKVGALVSEMWIEVQDDLAIPGVTIYVNGLPDDVASGTLNRFKIYRQLSETSYIAMTVYGMYHENFVYAGNTVRISSRTALESAVESGFVVPLYYDTLKRLPLVTSTELALSNRILVFNCYEVVELRWYETAVFKIIVTIIIAVVIAIFAPATIGLLGSNFNVGLALGVSGTAGLAVGAAVNALAAMVLFSVLEAGATAIFGEGVGTLIAILGMALAMNATAGFQTSGTWTMDFGEMIQAENLLGLTNAVSGSVQAWVKGELQSISEQATSDYDEYSREYEDIQNKTLEVLGYGGAVINPLIFLESAGSSADGLPTLVSGTESPATFLSRTMMNGSDIAEMSREMISSFVELTLTLPKPIT